MACYTYEVPPSGWRFEYLRHIIPSYFLKGAVWLKHDHDILDSSNKNEVKDLSTIHGYAFEIAVFSVRVITWSTALLAAFSFTWDRFFTPDFLMKDLETIDF